jgi:hypothetical protein
MAQRWCAGRAQHGRILPVLIRTDDFQGKNLALMEMLMLLCWVLRRFSFSKAPGVNLEVWEGKILDSDWFVVHQVPLLVSVLLRE